MESGWRLLVGGFSEGIVEGNWGTVIHDGSVGWVRRDEPSNSSRTTSTSSKLRWLLL